MLRCLRPFSVTAGALGLIALFLWVTMSGTEYQAGDWSSGRTTAGWFVLGSPIFLGLGLVMSLPFSAAACRARPQYAWMLLLAVFIPLIVVAFVETTPTARLREALGVTPPTETVIHRIEAFDSFNEGTTIVGFCSASPQFVQTLIEANALKQSGSGGVYLPASWHETLPEGASVYGGDNLTIYYDADRARLYFQRRQGQRRQP